MKETTISQLDGALRGELIRPQDPCYEELRRIWNGDIDRRPGLIARCTGPADVIAAVRFAREHHLLVAVRGGGHAVAGHAVCDGGVVIDLSAMRAVHVDPRAKTARAQGGCLWSDVDHETQAFGLGVTGGIVTHTGIGGLTLGGGIGHVMRAFGLTIDNLRSCDVVTAEGEHLLASADENPDLFWGLRGGGGNFGVVTSFEYQLHALGPIMLAGLLVWPMDEAPEVLRFFRDFVADAPDEVGIMANLRLASPLPAIPEELHGKPIVAIVACYAGPIDKGEAALRPLREFRAPAVDVLVPKPYASHQAMLDAALPHGRHYYWKSCELPPLTDAMIDVMIDQAARITSPYSTVPIFTLGGAVARIPENETAYSNRAAQHNINVVAAWEPDEPESDRHRQWVRDFWSAMQPFASGVYVNFLADEGQDRVRAAYGPVKYERLVGLKDKYDPTNFFRLNQNIKPRAQLHGKSCIDVKVPSTA